jgi:hypothetical protein
VLIETGLPKSGTGGRKVERIGRLAALEDASCEIVLDPGFVAELNAFLSEAAIVVGG